MGEITIDFRARYFSTAIARGLVGVGSIIYMCLQHNKEQREKSLEKEVVNYFDKNLGGLSFSEDYEIKKSMGIQDSSRNYIPTKEDWEKAYWKILKDTIK